MNLNKNAYACALCQDSFLDPNLLVEHVQTKHDSHLAGRTDLPLRN